VTFDCNVKFPAHILNCREDFFYFLCAAGGLVPAEEPTGQIMFQNVSFSYPSRPDICVIHNLSLVIPEASITAVVGASGSGKSTLAALLLRLYDPDSGTILLDRQPVSQLDLRWLRSHIGFVSQVSLTQTVGLPTRQTAIGTVGPTLAIMAHKVGMAVHLMCPYNGYNNSVSFTGTSSFLMFHS
jgi:ABC-type bacteriocin/lantibiotic exporter with double-glycine peptidase domain